MKQSNFRDVGDFHAKFGLPHSGMKPPTPPTPDLLIFRARFLLEELGEFFEASGLLAPGTSLKTMAKVLDESHIIGEYDPCGSLDALCDLNYVSLGTAHLLGLPFDAAWDEVQRANMRKERATGVDDPRNTRSHALNVVKPAGWTPPDHEPIILDAITKGRSY